jgi:hypothetical protein
MSLLIATGRFAYLAVGQACAAPHRHALLGRD